jgi:hypothetical protein
VLELPSVTARLRAYVAGDSSRSELEWWIADQVLSATEASSEDTEARSGDQILAYSIGEAFSALQGDDEESRLFAKRVVSCLEQMSDAEEVQDLLPLIRHHDAFAVLISKFARGLISPSGFRSIVRKRFTFDSVRPWLEQASHERLARLAELIEQEDFVGLRSLRALPTA